MSEYVQAITMPTKYVDMSASELEYDGAGLGLGKIGKYATIVTACIAGAGLVIAGIGGAIELGFSSAMISTVGSYITGAGAKLIAAGLAGSVFTGIFWGEMAAMDAFYDSQK